jgi:hypothetical protein
LSRDDVQEVIQKRESEEEVQENKSEYSHSADLSYAPRPSKMSINSFFESHHVMKRPDRKTLELAAKTMDRAVGKLGVLQMKIPVRLQGSRCLKMSRRRLGQSSNDKEGLKLYVATEEDSAIACLIKDIDELPAFERTWGRMYVRHMLEHSLLSSMVATTRIEQTPWWTNLKSEQINYS